MLLVLMTSSIFLARTVPELKIFLLYGKTQMESNESTFDLQIIQWFSKVYVPKRYFAHFYIVSSCLSSSLLACCYFRNSPVSINGLAFTIMVAIQGLRRTTECIFLEKSHKDAVIHISHYAVGILFYVIVNTIAYLSLYCFSSETSTFCILLSSAIFTSGSVLQSFFHHHLSTLVKYTLPTLGLFRYVACPHYFAEIIIYLALLPVTPRELQRTILLLLLWVAVNLSASAEQTIQFYRKKFSNPPPHAIIPYLY